VHFPAIYKVRYPKIPPSAPNMVGPKGKAMKEIKKKMILNVLTKVKKFLDPPLKTL
jgi:hypothetical protein